MFFRLQNKVLNSLLLCISTIYAAYSTPCGFLIANKKALTNLEKDLQEAVFLSVHLKYGSMQTFLLQNGLSTNSIDPPIFRSMKYDCFINIHCNLETYRKVTSLSKRKRQDHLYTRGTFFIFAFERDKVSFTRSEILREQDKPHRLFLVRISLRLQDNYKMNLHMIKKYYFCAFCKFTFVSLDPEREMLETQLTDYQNKWTNSSHFIADHQGYLPLFSTCSKISSLNLPEGDLKFCGSQYILFQSIVFFSRLNITLTLVPSENLRKYTRTMSTMTWNRERTIRFYSSTPVMNSLENAGLIYCLERNSEFQKQTDIWLLPVPSNVLLLLSNTIAMILSVESRLSLKKFKNYKLLIELSKYMYNMLRSLTRQTVHFHSIRFVLLELICVTLLITYESHITLEFIAKTPQRSFEDLDDLYKNNYSFLLTRGIHSTGNNWLKKKYNRESICRVFEFENNTNRSLIESLLWEQPSGIKYALLDPVYGNGALEVLKSVSQPVYMCQKIYPQDSGFQPTATFYVFKSTLAEYFKEGVSRFQASGTDKLIQRTKIQFGIHSPYMRNNGVVKANHPLRMTVKEAQDNDHYNLNMIQLKNYIFILYSSCTLIVVSVLALVSEILAYRARHVTKVKLMFL